MHTRRFTQKVGTGVNHHFIESPRSAVEGIFWSTKMTIGMIPPSAKWTKRVIICATVSDSKANDVTKVKGTMQIGYRSKS